MTGGQPAEGSFTVSQIAHQVAAEGTRRLAIVSDEPDKYPANYFPEGATVILRAAHAPERLAGRVSQFKRALLADAASDGGALFTSFRRVAGLWLPAVALLAASLAPSSAESYPSRRIAPTVPFPAGSATDAVTRRLAESIRDVTGVTVLVENKPGADGNLAAISVLRADADGYTVFVTTNSTQAANVNLFNSMPYDPRADFAPVAGLMTIPLMLTVRNDFPARSVVEFVALAKTRGTPLSFGSGNTSSRGAAELFRFRAGIEMQHVPYRGMPQALTDVLSGQIDCLFADPASAQG
jgi:tripartite-type tricarboxylate transporter receptor subunit TctC